MAWNELELHRFLQANLSDAGLVHGRGNDAVVTHAMGRHVVSCVDQTISGVHFEPGTPGRKVGHKACARALSDLAAAGVMPTAVLAALALGPDLDEGWIRQVLLGIAETAEAFDATLAGGDLSGLAGPSASDQIIISVTALSCKGRASVGRQYARPGDRLLVTGPVGGSLLGRHLAFQPRLKEGRQLALSGARCMMDTTDGLALDLSRLAEASDVRIVLDSVPIHPDARKRAATTGRSAFDHALHDGEDYELIATLSPRLFEREGKLLRRLLPDARWIGRVEAGAGLFVPSNEAAAEAASTPGAVDPDLIPVREWTRGERNSGWVHGVS